MSFELNNEVHLVEPMNQSSTSEKLFLRVMHGGPFEGSFFTRNAWTMVGPLREVLQVMHDGPFEGIFLHVMHSGPFEGSFTRKFY